MPAGQQRLGEAIPGTTSVAVTVAPASALSQATVAIQTNGGPRIEAPLQAFLDQQGVQPGAYLLYLDGRPWTIDISSPGHKTQSTRLTLAPGDTSRMVSVSLKPDATPITVNLGPADAVAAGASLTFSSTNGSGEVFEVPDAQASVTQGLAPAGQDLISVSLVGDHGGDHEALAQQSVAELRGWFGSGVDAWRFLRGYRIQRALPKEMPEGLGATPLARSRDLATGHGDSVRGVGDRILVCGDWLATPSQSGALESGRHAADRILT